MYFMSLRPSLILAVDKQRAFGGDKLSSTACTNIV